MAEVPTLAVTAYPGCWGELDRFAQILVTAGVERGLVGPREVERIWDRHVLNCTVVAELLPPDVHVADIGSGAGLPGVALAIVRPDIRVTLVEPLLRRSVFLEESVAELGLADRVTVARARAEEVTHPGGFDVVTARALAPMDRLVGWCLPLVRVGGMLLALKGSRVQDELAGAAPMVAAWGGAPAEVLTVGAGIVDPPTTVVRVVRTAVGSAAGRRPGHLPHAPVGKGPASRGRAGARQSDRRRPGGAGR